MKVTIELSEGNCPYNQPTREGIDAHIETLERAIKGKPLAHDFVNLCDIQSILRGIRKELPRTQYEMETDARIANEITRRKTQELIGSTSK